MAVWQFNLFFLPRGLEIPALGAEGHFDIAPLPPGRYDLGMRLTEQFGAPAQYCAGLLVWGIDEGDRVDVTFESRAVAEVYVRCDARSPSFWFFETVCAHARAMDRILFSPEQRLLMEPEPNKLWAALETSRASAYVRDPEGYLKATAAYKATLH